MALKAPYDKWGMHSTRTNTHTRSDGSTSTNIYTVWTQRGRRFIIALYEKRMEYKEICQTDKGRNGFRLIKISMTFKIDTL